MSVLRREQYPPRSIFEREADFWWQVGHLWGTSIWQAGQLAGVVRDVGDQALHAPLGERGRRFGGLWPRGAFRGGLASG